MPRWRKGGAEVGWRWQRLGRAAEKEGGWRASLVRSGGSWARLAPAASAGLMIVQARSAKRPLGSDGGGGGGGGGSGARMAHRTSGVGGPGPHASVWRQLGGGGGLRLGGLAEFGRAERRPTLVVGAARMGADWGRASDGCGVSAGTVRETRSTVGAAFDGRLALRLGRISTATPLADCVNTLLGSVLESAAAPASSDRRGRCCCKSTGSCGCLSTVEGVRRSSSVMCLYCGGGLGRCEVLAAGVAGGWSVGRT